MTQKPVLRRRNCSVPQKAFRFQAKKGFFTYPRCPIPKEIALELLTAALQKWSLVKYRICEEEHKDEAKHLHAYVACSKKISTKNAKFADLSWEGKTYHGNYQTCRNPDAVLEYCKKGENPNYIDNMGTSLYPALIATAQTHGVKRAMADLIVQNPELFVREGKRIKSNLELVAKPAIATIEKAFLFNIPPPAVIYWSNNPRKRSLWLKGPSDTGKTSFAISCFEKPLLVRHLDQLKGLTDDHDGIVFDDCSFTHWPRSSVLHLLDLDQDSGINVKHSHVVIPKGLPRIFTSNDNIWPASDAAVTKRLIGCFISYDLRLQTTGVHDEHPFAPSEEMFFSF